MNESRSKEKSKTNRAEGVSDREDSVSFVRGVGENVEDNIRRKLKEAGESEVDREVHNRGNEKARHRDANRLHREDSEEGRRVEIYE